MKIYIAGAITNNLNYEDQFKAKEKELTACGYTVINPVKNTGFDYKDYIDMGLTELSKCEAIYLMDGYKESKGALLELRYAIVVGMEVHFEKGFTM